MIVSRGEELRRLDELLADLGTGNGRTLVVHGDPGIGKSTLLDALVARCGDDVEVLRAGGVETEAELAFAALSDLLTPVVRELPALPAPQSAALGAALALAPPAPGDRLAVCVATLGLLRAAAAQRPVLAVVDDLQWLDAASRECILFTARRAGGRLAVVLAARDPAPEVVLSGGKQAVLRLEPLHGDASLELLGRVAPGLAPPVAAAVAEAAAGNPLVLVELPATLTPGQRAGLAEVELPLAPGARLQGAFAGRIAELDPLARRALLVAATHVGADLKVIAAACRAAGTDVVLLAQAEELGLVRLTGERVTFSHPINRGAAYHTARPAERRRAHRALAGVVEGAQRAWHLAAAAVGPDEVAAAGLEQAADGAAARRGYASASAALERAARLSPENDDAARRLLAAGQAAGAAGAQDRSLVLLEEASAMASDRDLRARAQHLRGRLMIWSGRPAEAMTLLVAEAGHVAEHDRVLGATMLADAANSAANIKSVHRAEALARRAVAMLGDGGEPSARAAVLAMLGWVLVLRGKAAQGRPVLGDAERLARGLDPLGVHWPWLHLLLRARCPLDELEAARTESTALSERARDAGALAALSSALLVAADAEFRLGCWDAAETTTLEAIRAADDAGQPAWSGAALCTRARLTAARGLEDESRAVARTALGIAESLGFGSGLRYVHGALGFLALGFDRVDEAITELETVERVVAGSGMAEPTIVPWLPDLAEAYVRSGRATDAWRVQEAMEQQAASSGTAFAAAVAARGLGMLAEDFPPHFARALAIDDRRPMPFERARTQLAFGRRLHRARRRAEARERLREALAGFERLGAAAWADQAAHELRAAGARRRAPHDDRLTPQELRVAAGVRRGASNREIAAELFLSPKTIEFHLRQINRKLGTRSRSRLVALLAREVPGEVSPGPGEPEA